MKPRLILFISLLPFQALVAQSPGYFGAGGTPGLPTPTPAFATPTPTGSVPPELAAAQTHYDQEVKQVAAPIRARYLQTLEALKRTYGGQGDLAAALAVQQEIDRLGAALNSPSSKPKEAKVVIWNQHNAGHNNYGAKTLNVALIANGKEVWRQNGIQIPWQADEDTKVEVNVPYVPTNKLRVEVVETAGGRGVGLAEIEYWWDGRNHASKRPATVSAVWGNSAKCGAATLTDGITTSREESTGYWSAQTNAPGWAEVSLNVGD